MPIIDRRTRLKARRALRKQKRQFESVTQQADDNLDRHVVRRFGRLVAVRRFVIIWVCLILLLAIGAAWQVRGLDKYYLSTEPASGGTYREGIVGSFTNASPLFATSSVDASVSKLLFSGLFKVAPSGKVIGDLATGYSVDPSGKIYTVTLRENVRWHDGEPFKLEDVLFTYKLIKNPETRSPLLESWRGVSVKKIDERTVSFTVPNPLSSFPYAMTNGIVPMHLLEKVTPADLRSSPFNTIQPVGTGPFAFNTLEVVGTDLESRQERIALTKNDDFYESNGGPNNVVLRSYRSEDTMLKDFEEQVIQSMVGLSFVPEEYVDHEEVQLVSVPLTSAVMAFFNNSSAALNDVKVRQALLQAVNIDELRALLQYSSVAVDSPFLKSHFSYDPAVVQHGYDEAATQSLLKEAGWAKGEDGKLAKDGKTMKLRLVSQSLSEYAAITQKLQQIWAALGVEVEAILQPEEDIQSGAIARHDYDVLLYGISIGYDPDVFAYWHSSQADATSGARLNLSEYKNATADESLESGRTRIDEDLRKVKYKPFLDVWKADVPALAIYQPRFVMVVSGTFEGFENGQLSSATDRFYSIGQWKIRNAVVVK